MEYMDIKKIVDWLGADGARAGMRHSKRLTLNELFKIASGLGIKYKSKIKRNELIDLLILQFDKRIEKNIEELGAMNAADLAEYLDRTGCSKEEIIELLESNGFIYKKSESRASLIRHAADQISGVGLFKRIARNTHEQ
ncbi:hypothetical protein [Bacillus sp. SN10]|uniref:hypothetical protein n=1 Tax=Bacillus sp. SN10 TaxID=2056493 RepID=UPI000C326BE0|nr:hypothetical protein [Bacillus sp. SN10]PKJ52331.1 hypothetical protein CWE34_28565 [Bacillus sp. SN10]